MAGRTIGFGNDVVEGSNRGGNGDQGAAPRRVIDFRNSLMSSANVQLLEDFILFCDAKKVNPLHGLTSFRNDVTMRFGDQLPSYVVDELCKLVIDNTHGKCRSCKMPTESLILSVLQILTDAAQVVLSSKENINPPPIAFVNSKADGNAILSESKGIVNSMGRDFPTHCSQEEAMRIGAGFSQSIHLAERAFCRTCRSASVPLPYNSGRDGAWR